MKKAYRMFKRGNVFYAQNNETGKQESLQTKKRDEACRLVNARNEAMQTPLLNRALGGVFLSAIDPEAVQRTWKVVMEQFCGTGRQSTQERRKREVKSPAYASILNKPLVETNAEDLRRVMSKGGASVNHTLHWLHSHAVGMNWLPAPIIPVKLWPKMTKGVRRGINAEEHAKILAAERNEERRAYYQILWEIGAAQTDAANLSAENVDWTDNTISFSRQKTGTLARLSIGRPLASLLAKLPQTGFLFPKIAATQASCRASEFSRRCKLAEITGVTLHSYRYGWAERAATCGYPERFAQFALGHKSQAVHRAYAKKAEVTCPAMDSYEGKIIPLHTKPAASEQLAG